MSGRDKRALTIGGGFLLVIGVYLLGVEKLLDWHDEKTVDHATTAARLKREIERGAERAVQAKRVEDWQANWTTLEPPKLYNEQIEILTKALMEKAGGNGLEIKEVKESTALALPDEKDTQYATFTIKGKIEWGNAFKLVDALYKTPNVLSLEDFELSGEGGQLDLAMKISVLIKAPQGSDDPWAS